VQAVQPDCDVEDGDGAEGAAVMASELSSAKVTGEHVVIQRCYRNGDVVAATLTFADVKLAAEVLREHLLRQLPPSIPDEAARNAEAPRSYVRGDPVPLRIGITPGPTVTEQKEPTR
jgi:hypothetical protein